MAGKPKKMPPWLMKGKGAKEGSKAEEAMDKKQGMPAFKKGGKVKKK